LSKFWKFIISNNSDICRTYQPLNINDTEQHQQRTYQSKHKKQITSTDLSRSWTPQWNQNKHGNKNRFKKNIKKQQINKWKNTQNKSFHNQKTNN
jgi:hypothetical protein